MIGEWFQEIDVRVFVHVPSFQAREGRKVRTGNAKIRIERCGRSV